MGVLNYWAFILGGLFVLMNAGNLYIGCSKSVEGWGWGKYTCSDLESALSFNFNVASLENCLILMMSATVFERRMDFIKVCGPTWIMMLVFIANWWSLTINGHTMPHVVYFIDAFVFGTFAIAAYAHKDSAGVVKSETMAFGALNYWTFAIGVAFTLMCAANQYTGCSSSLEAWGWGKYTCSDLESGMSFNCNMTNIQIQLVLMMCATITVRKLDLVKLIAPVLIMIPVFLAYWAPKTINGHTMPNAIYYIDGIVLGSFLVAFVMHPRSTASARQMQSTAPLLSA